ncbi:MAG TPA: ABC transporter substrate-binding protein [Candidatus Binatia bacterium]|jgi:NitT/TauT family transport system substrate-binding protein|nr:ABC transporter substrate-binding protein [Candidatus Binatia bacterium]
MTLLFAGLSWGGESPILRANYSGISGGFAPVWIALEKGLFTKYGLNLDLRFIAPATATQGLLAKSLDIVNPGGEIIEAGLNGEPVVYMAGVLSRAVMSLYAKPEVRSLGDLKGKVLAVTLPGATTDFAARVLLQQGGLAAGKDVKVIYLKGMAEIFAGISQGNADAGIFTSPTTLKARHAGLKELINVTEKNIPMIHAAFASTKDYLKSHPEEVRRFLQGYLEGIKVARADAELAKQIIGKYTKTTDRDDLEDSYRTFLPAWEKVPVVPVASVQTMLNFATHPGAKTAKAESFIDNSALLELEKSGFVDRLYK